MSKAKHLKFLSVDQKTISFKEKLNYLLGNTMFWLLVLITVGIIIKLAFFPKGLDILEMALILFWRYLLEKVKYHTDILLISVFVIVLSMPVLLSVNQTVIAGGFAIWIFYLLIIELILNIRSTFRKT